MPPLLSVKNLSTHFFTRDGIIKAVDDISYDINKGEVIGLVGESGCGKSVSALSLMRLIPNPPGKIVNGKILFEGRDLLKLSKKDMCNIRGNQISMIFQEPMSSLNPVLTIGDQIKETMMLHKQLSKDFSSALLLITHNLGLVARYADRVNVMYAGRIIEKATARDLYAAPRHPYTIGLMASVPRLDQDIKKKLVPIDGQPPDLLCLPPGCPFHPRCRYRIDRCSIENPELEVVSDNHEKACWVDVRNQ